MSSAHAYCSWIICRQEKGMHKEVHTYFSFMIGMGNKERRGKTGPFLCAVQSQSPMDCSMPGSSVLHYLKFAQIHFY